MPDEIFEEILDASTLTWTELVLAIVILVGSIFAARVVRRTVRSFLEHRPGVAEHTAESVGRISGWAVILVGIVAALIILGFQMGPVVLLLLLLAVMVAISGRRIMENWASGLSLQVMTPFVVGDRIETEGIVGWVEEINAREVVLTSRDRRTIRIPNTSVVNSVIYNYTDDQQRRTEMGFEVSYNDDPITAAAVTADAVAGLELVTQTPHRSPTLRTSEMMATNSSSASTTTTTTANPSEPKLPKPSSRLSQKQASTCPHQN